MSLFLFLDIVLYLFLYRSHWYGLIQNIKTSFLASVCWKVLRFAVRISRFPFLCVFVPQNSSVTLKKKMLNDKKHHTNVFSQQFRLTLQSS